MRVAVNDRESNAKPVDERGWATRPLSSLGRWLSGGTPSLATEKYWTGDIPWVSPKDMKTPDIGDSIDHISAHAVKDGATRLLPAGAVLLVIRGMILAHTLPVARTNREMAFNQDIKALVVNDDVDSRFVRYWISAHADDLLSLTTESTHGTKRLPSDMLLGVLMSCPASKAEQEGISQVLSDVDALIESLEYLLAKKRQIKQGAMQELLAGKRRLSEFTDEWQTAPLEELFTFSGGLSASRAELSTEGYCYLHYGDIHTSESSFVDVKNAYADIPKLNISLGEVPRASLLADGDVVFVDASEDEDGASRHVVVSNLEGIPFISGLHTIVAKPKNDRVDRLFRRYCFQSPAVKAQFHFFAVGTKVLGVSKANIKKIELCLPSVPEQAAIAAILTEIDAEIEALQQQVDKVRQLKQGMMQELLTGRIRLVDEKTARDLQLVRSA